jgi:hypothetical protein
MVAVYRRPDVASWSAWWVLALCGVVAVEGYASSLWYALDPTANLNGFVDAGARLAAAGAAFLPLLLPPTVAVRLPPPLALAATVPRPPYAAGCVAAVAAYDSPGRVGADRGMVRRERARRAGGECVRAVRVL